MAAKRRDGASEPRSRRWRTSATRCSRRSSARRGRSTPCGCAGGWSCPTSTTLGVRAAAAAARAGGGVISRRDHEQAAYESARMSANILSDLRGMDCRARELDGAEYLALLWRWFHPDSDGFRRRSSSVSPRRSRPRRGPRAAAPRRAARRRHPRRGARLRRPRAHRLPQRRPGRVDRPHHDAAGYDLALLAAEPDGRAAAVAAVVHIHAAIAPRLAATTAFAGGGSGPPSSESSARRS